MNNKKKEIITQNAPAPVASYSQAIDCDGVLYCSGQLGIDMETGALVKGGGSEQARVALSNLKEIVEAAGASMDDVLKTTLFIVDMGEAPAINDVYSIAFSAPFPARSAFQVAGLPLGAKVEIDAMVRLPK